MSREMSQLQQKQLDKLAELGSHLRQVREENRLSLEEVAAQTLIQARLLHAIEAGKLNQLPEPVYIQGFIKRYAEVLGLDGASFSKAFPTGQELPKRGWNWKDLPIAQLRPLHLYLAYVFLIVTSVSALSYVVDRSTPASSAALEQPLILPPANQQGGSDSAPTSPGITRPRPDPIVARSNRLDETVRVNVKLTEQSWLRIVADGSTEFEGVLPEGSQRTWTAEEQITVLAGNAGGVIVAHNEGQPAPMGDPGTVREMTFSNAQNAASLPRTGAMSILR